MAKQLPSQKAAATKQLTELALLYQFSNTMLSTIRLNKLTHLILTALTSRDAMLFDRAILFLRNEKSGVLQGMLGVTWDTTPEGLQIIGSDDALSSQWDISEEVIAQQRSTEFCSLVRATRFDIDTDCPVIKRIIIDQNLCLIDDAGCHECESCDFIKHLGATSFAAAPLVARGKSLGIIVVDNPHSVKPINRDDLRFLQLFANQAGMAIENSMLYNRIEEAHSSLRDARERLIHGERLAAIGEMAADLVHELKNPLITIGGFAGRLLKGLPTESREHHYADTIVKEVCRLEKMLSDILAFSRKPTICYSACDLGDILQDCFVSCATTLEDHHICLSSNFEDGCWPLVGDAYQLKQVFLNLILNACEVMPNGGILTVHAESLPLEGREVKIRIADSGGGIPPEILPQIFKPFFTTKRHGTGLGLAIVNRILLNHNGSIEAANEGSGSIFSVTLPLARTAQ
ncbi:MAG: GAF domain-containing protein [Desulfuromonadales bacterium]|nr:GAF domain-containing protein [Desulfuromonadales bacterium]